MEGDPDSVVAHYALHKWGKPPSWLTSLSEKERAFVFASISIQMENDKKAIKEAKKSRR